MDGWTTATQVAAAAALLAALVALALLVVLLRVRAAATRRAEEDRAAREEVLRRLEALERPAPAAASAGASAGEVAEFVITDVGREPAPVAEAPTRIEGRLFADVVLRETVVKAASWTHGVRTALSAENRNRIRFEMKRETKRSTKQRKADVKEALRQYYARQEADRAGPDANRAAVSQEDLA